jgi:murein DD-endopeptidase MepM/ murein hydrolase activator NlpD
MIRGLLGGGVDRFRGRCNHGIESMGKTFQPGSLLYACSGAFIGIFATMLVPPAGLPGFNPEPITSPLPTSLAVAISLTEPEQLTWADEIGGVFGVAMGLAAQTVRVQQGDTLVDVLVNTGVDRTSAYNVVEAVSEVYDLKRLQVGQEFELDYDALGAAGDTTPLASLNFEVLPGHSIYVVRQDDGTFSAKEVIANTHRAFSRGEGVITSTLFEAAAEQNIPPNVLSAMVKLFSYSVDFQRDIKRGDKFQVMYEQVLTEDSRAVRNLDIRYASMVVNGSLLKFYAFRQDNGTYEYYNDKGEGIRKALLRTPVNGARLTSNFGIRRHPILGYSILHRGVDFGVPTGTPIMAAGDGTIEMSGPNGTYGNYVRIRHNGDYSTAYAHMSRFQPDLAVGKHVRQGQIIGYVGATGRVTGPHLHFEVLQKKKQVNPISIKFPSAQKLEGTSMTKFRTARAQTDLAFSQINKPADFSASEKASEKQAP